MPLENLTNRSLGWRWYAAALLFLSGFIGLVSGVDVSERPDVSTSDLLTKAYYALGLFVVGGLDIGTPQDGPFWGRVLLWIAYFGAPLLTASAVIEALVQVLEPGRWQIRRIRDHIIVFGSGRLTISYLRVLRRHSPKTPVVIVDTHFDSVREEELKQTFHATIMVGDLTHDYLLERLRLHRAKRVLMLGDNDYQGFEAATRILAIEPKLKNNLILHSHNLRLMRSVQGSELASQCEIFNTYNLAAEGLVRDQLVQHFRETPVRDIVVMAGFGRFGQSVLEELQYHAAHEIDQVAVLDRDASRRVLVVDEQEKIHADYDRHVFEGDIAHPDVWRQLTDKLDLEKDNPTVVLGTGEEQNNLRTALWIKQKYPNAVVYARTNDRSNFALAVGGEHGIKNISITQLVEQYMPERWMT
ncbi:MAG: NAD-binding protein [Pseudomonadota bacterium]